MDLLNKDREDSHNRYENKWETVQKTILNPIISSLFITNYSTKNGNFMSK